MRNHAGNRSPQCTEWYLMFGKVAPPEDIQAEVLDDRELVRKNLAELRPRYFSTYPPGQMTGPLPFGSFGRPDCALKNLYSEG